jgi:hypothetical protein
MTQEDCNSQNGDMQYAMILDDQALTKCNNNVQVQDPKCNNSSLNLYDQVATQYGVHNRFKI